METAKAPNISQTATLNEAPWRVSYLTREPSIAFDQNDEEDGENNDALVDLGSSDDPKNPKNWSLQQKWATTAIVLGFAFITPVTSSIVAPASDPLAEELVICDDVVFASVTSIYVFAYAFGSLFFGPMSEIYGPSRVLQLSNMWYLVWNLACGFAQDESQLLAFRFLSGLGGSAPFVIGGGLLGSCWRTKEHGEVMALYTLAPILGPAMGPIAGAWIAELTTWRWVFWSTSIADAVILALTCMPFLFENRTEKIRRSIDTMKSLHRQVRPMNDKRDRSWRAIMMKALARPFSLLTQEPIIQWLGLYLAFVYGVMFLFVTSIHSIYVEVYRQPFGIAGLHYIALGLGMFVALQVNARTMDTVYMYLRHKNGGAGQPEFRLPGMFVGTMVLPIGLLVTGWSVQARTHWIVPDLGLLLVGAGITFSWVCIQAYITDAFTKYAASATAATTFLWSLAGGGFPLFAPVMYVALGFGMGNTVLAVVAVVAGCPAPWILWYFGQRMRNWSRHAR